MNNNQYKIAHLVGHQLNLIVMPGYSAVDECLNVPQHHCAALKVIKHQPVLMCSTRHGSHTIQLLEKMSTANNTNVIQHNIFRTKHAEY